MKAPTAQRSAPRAASASWPGEADGQARVLVGGGEGRGDGPDVAAEVEPHAPIHGRPVQGPVYQLHGVARRLISGEHSTTIPPVPAPALAGAPHDASVRGRWPVRVELELRVPVHGRVVDGRRPRSRRATTPDFTRARRNKPARSCTCTCARAPNDASDEDAGRSLAPGRGYTGLWTGLRGGGHWRG